MISNNNNDEIELTNISITQSTNTSNGQLVNAPSKSRIGLLYMLVGSISMSFMAVTVKICKQYTAISVVEICYFRSFFMAIGCLIHAHFSKISVLDVGKENMAKWVLLRVVFGYLSFTFQFIGIFMLPLSIAMILYFTQPISAAIVNFLFNKERLVPLEILSIFSAMVGVVVLTCPEMLGLIDSQEGQISTQIDSQYVIGVIFTLMGSLASGFAYLTMRKLGENVNSAITTFYFGIFSGITSFITFAIAPKQTMSAEISFFELGLLLAIGIFGWIAQEGVSKALQTEKAGRAASLNYLQVVVACIADISFFQRSIAWTDCLGAALILIFTLINSIKKCF